MVKSNRNVATYRDNHSTDHSAQASSGGAGVSRPWRQWHSSARAYDSLPLEVSSPRRPQWGRYIYLFIIFCIVAFVAREIYVGLFWFNAQGAVSGRQYSISPSQTVSITEILVSPSQKVEAGDALARLNSPELEKELARSEAEIARLQSDLTESHTRLQDNREQLRSDIEAYRADLTVLEDKSQAEVDRINAMRRLVAVGAVSQSSLQKLEIEHAETWADYTRVKAQLEAAYRRSSNYSKSEIEASDSQLPEQRLASLTNLRDSIQKQLGRLELTAPSKGTVSKVFVSKGDVLKAGEPAVVLVERDELRAYLHFPPSAQTTLEVGQRVSGHTAGGDKIPLRIIKIYPSIEDGASAARAFNAPRDASLVVEAVPDNEQGFPPAMNSGTPIYGRVPRWSFATNIDRGVESLKETITEVQKPQTEVNSHNSPSPDNSKKDRE